MQDIVMFEIFRRSRRSNKVQKTKIRLSVEELEGRCLMSQAIAALPPEWIPPSRIAALPADWTPPSHMTPLPPVWGPPFSGLPADSGPTDSGPTWSHAIDPTGGITTGPDGYIWFLETDGLGRLDPKTGAIQDFAIGVHPSEREVQPSYLLHEPSIVEGQDGRIWFLAGNQVVRFNPATGAIDKFNLPNGEVPYDPIVLGPDGKIWVVESQGVASIDPATGAVRDYSLPLAPVGIAVGQDGTVWMTTASWDHLEKLNPATGQVQTFATGHPTQSGIAVDSEGHIWVSFWGMGIGSGSSSGSALGEFDPAKEQ
jgi:streptogramin lyase